MASFAMPQGVTVEQMLVAMSQREPESAQEPAPKAKRSRSDKSAEATELES